MVVRVISLAPLSSEPQAVKVEMVLVLSVQTQLGMAVVLVVRRLTEGAGPQDILALAATVLVVLLRQLDQVVVALAALKVTEVAALVCLA
jgi:hypothetical protein